MRKQQAASRVIVLVLVTLGMLVAGCGESGGGGGKSSLPAVRATPTPPGLSAILQRANQPGWQDTTYTFTSTVTNVSDGSVSSQYTGEGVETINPPRSDVREQSPTGGESVETIQDGTTVYSRVGAQSMWSILTGELASGITAPSNNLASVLPTSPDNMQNLTLVGADQVEGYPVWHIKGTTTRIVRGVANPATEYVDFWVRQDNYYVVQVKTHDTIDDPMSQNEDNQTLYTKWNTGVTINVPPASAVAP